MNPCVLCKKSDSPQVIFGVCRRCAVEIKIALNNYKEGKWSQFYDACIVCKGTHRAAHAWGKCKVCYQRDLRKEYRQMAGSIQRAQVRKQLLEKTYSSKDGRCIGCMGLFLKNEEKVETEVTGYGKVNYHRKCWLKELN